MKEKGNKKTVHGLSWQFADEKSAVYADYLASEAFAREVASNNLTMEIAVSSLIAVISFLGIFDLNRLPSLKSGSALPTWRSMPSCLVLPCTVPRRGATTFLNWS
jgi:hypothetical protein